MLMFRLSVVGLLASAIVSAAEPAFRIEVSTLLTGHGTQFYTQSRGALIPGEPTRVVVTTQETDPTGAHGYKDMFAIETADNGRTWSPPKKIESLHRKRMPEGHD